MQREDNVGHVDFEREPGANDNWNGVTTLGRDVQALLGCATAEKMESNKLSPHGCLASCTIAIHLIFLLHHVICLLQTIW
jgi:hypothetical protein